jgi:hypothetical protein
LDLHTVIIEFESDEAAAKAALNVLGDGAIRDIRMVEGVG